VEVRHTQPVAVSLEWLSEQRELAGVEDGLVAHS